MKTGVYQIRNTVNGKIYVGSVAGKYGFCGRWSKHRNDLLKQHHHSVHLQRAWNKYGVDTFVFEILEECVPENCIEREQHYMDTLLFAKRFGVALCTISNIKAGRKWGYVNG